MPDDKADVDVKKQGEVEENSNKDVISAIRELTTAITAISTKLIEFGSRFDKLDKYLKAGKF